jgi:hypothetical protein
MIASGLDAEGGARNMLKKIAEFLTLKWLWNRHEGKR